MKIDFNRVIGKIKPMHAVNNPPFAGGANFGHFHYLKDAGIPFVRLHDTGGAYGGHVFVDIPNLFRNFDADENDPASYDFAFTDALMKGICETGSKPYFRLGVTIENYHYIKAYNIYPPADFDKWARICERVIAHYNEGWADGFHMGIEYWEIWNEPDNMPDIEDNPMWKAPFSEYIRLYDVSARYLKKCYPNIKIGGYASCGFYAIFPGEFSNIAASSRRTDYFIECLDAFLSHLQKNGLPLDFFSWHSYSAVDKNAAYAQYIRKKLDDYGFPNAETHLNEWNPATKYRGTLKDAANVAENFLVLQDEPVDMLMYYSGQATASSYNGLFESGTARPYKVFYVFKAFNKLYTLGEEVAVEGATDTLRCIAAKGDDGVAVMLVNRGEPTAVALDLSGANAAAYTVSRINENESLEEEYTVTAAELASLAIGHDEVILVKGK